MDDSASGRPVVVAVPAAKKVSKFKRRRAPPPAAGSAGGSKRPAAGMGCWPCGEGEIGEGAPADFRLRPVAYVYSAASVAAAALHPQHPTRPKMVHALLQAYGLVDRMSVIGEVGVDRLDLTKFHSRAYVDYLQDATNARSSLARARSAASPDTDGVKAGEFGLDYDCECALFLFSNSSRAPLVPPARSRTLTAAVILRAPRPQASQRCTPTSGQ